MSRVTQFPSGVKITWKLPGSEEEPSKLPEASIKAFQDQVPVMLGITVNCLVAASAQSGGSISMPAKVGWITVMSKLS